MRAVFDANIMNVMKQMLFSSFSEYRLCKALTLSYLLMSFVAIFSVQSAIRIIGPPEKLPSSTTVKQLSHVSQSVTRERITVGPTRDSDTLWSIATHYKPNNSVSVYQILGAIFRLNPSAFEKLNMHGLIPNSILVMPMLDEMQKENSEDVAQRLQLDQARKDIKQTFNLRPLIEQVTILPVDLATPVLKLAMPSDVEKKAKMKIGNMQKESLSTEANISGKNADMEKQDPMMSLKPDMVSVQDHIDESDQRMGKLVESNHILKIRLAEVHNELSALKEHMMFDKERTDQIKQLLKIQRMHQAQIENKEPSFLESLIYSPLILTMIAIIPALLVIGTVTFIIMRHRRNDDVEESHALDCEVLADMNVMTVPEMDNDTDQLVFEEDESKVTEDTNADDSFVDANLFDPELDDINLADSLEHSDKVNELSLPISEDLNSDPEFKSSLESNFDASPELGVIASTEGEIELEDMEHVLDEMVSPGKIVLSPDEELAAMWEQSLAEGNDSDVDDIDTLLDVEQTSSSSNAESDRNEEEPKQKKTDEPKDILNGVLNAKYSLKIDDTSMLDDINYGRNESKTIKDNSTDDLSLSSNSEKTCILDADVFLEDILGKAPDDKDVNLGDSDALLDESIDALDDILDESKLIKLESPHDDVDALDTLVSNNLVEVEPAFDVSDLHGHDEDVALIDSEFDSSFNVRADRNHGTEEAECHDFVVTEHNTLAFQPEETIRLDDIDEFSENNALNAALAEQKALDKLIPVGNHSRASQPLSSGTLSVDMDTLFELKDNAHQVAGLNMNVLLSEPVDDDSMNLDEFNIQNIEISEDESNIWQVEQTLEPKLEREDWFAQPGVLDDNVEAMNLDADLDGLLKNAETESVAESTSDNTHISIEELMKGDDSPQVNPNAVVMNLNAGLDESSNAFSDMEPTDGDSINEAAIHMDLAKAYLKINDMDGALQLLEKVMQSDNASLKDEAYQMIKNLS
nr:FimV/HubP family polar landmark protein [Candidatus Enterovibrio luxaltus]